MRVLVLICVAVAAATAQMMATELRLCSSTCQEQYLESEVASACQEGCGLALFFGRQGLPERAVTSECHANCDQRYKVATDEALSCKFGCASQAAANPSYVQEMQETQMQQMDRFMRTRMEQMRRMSEGIMNKILPNILKQFPNGEGPVAVELDLTQPNEQGIVNGEINVIFAKQDGGRTHPDVSPIREVADDESSESRESHVKHGGHHSPIHRFIHHYGRILLVLAGSLLLLTLFAYTCLFLAKKKQREANRAQSREPLWFISTSEETDSLKKGSDIGDEYCVDNNPGRLAVIEMPSIEPHA